MKDLSSYTEAQIRAALSLREFVAEEAAKMTPTTPTGWAVHFFEDAAQRFERLYGLVDSTVGGR